MAGIRTPQSLEKMATQWPGVYDELYKYQDQQEKYYNSDMQLGEEIYGSRYVSRSFLTRSLLLLHMSACIVRSISYSTQGIDIEVSSDVRKKKCILKG